MGRRKRFQLSDFVDNKYSLKYNPYYILYLTLLLWPSHNPFQHCLILKRKRPCDLQSTVFQLSNGTLPILSNVSTIGLTLNATPL